MSPVKQRPNFYDILDLDEKESNISNIKKQLEKKKREWSLWRNQGTPTQQAKASDYLSLINEIEIVINDTEKLKFEKNGFITLKKQKKLETFKELDFMLEIITSNSITDDEFKTIEKHFKGEVTPAEIEKRLKKRGVILSSKIPKKERKSIKRDTIDSSTEKSINELVEQLNHKDLYDFLEHRQNASISALQNKAESILSACRGKTDIVNSRKSKLAGFAKNIFKNESNKEKYNNTLATVNLKKLDLPLKLAGSDKLLTIEEMNSLIKMARKESISEDAARDYIEEIASKRKWVIVQNNQTKKLQLLSCGFCGELADSENQKLCKGCGKNLIQPCPLCGNLTPTEQSACSKCGCTTGDAKEVYHLLAESKVYIENSNYVKARKNLNKILGYWKGWKTAEKELTKIRKLESDQTSSLSNISLLIKSRKFYAADTALKKYAHSYNKTTIDKEMKETQTHLQQAKKLYDEAEKYNRSKQYDLALTKYDESLSVCVDYQPSQEALSKIPLPIPSNVKGKILNSSIQVSWAMPNSAKKLSYKVIRKEKSIPHNVNDGTVIGDTANNTIVDSGIMAGETYYYGIFPMRNNIPNKKCAITGPYLYPGDIQKFYTHSSDNRITINWTPIQNSIGIEIWRKEGQTSIEKGEGIQLKSSKETLVDSKLVNNKTYTYLLISAYKDPSTNNKILYSNGIKIHATPTSPPKPIEDIKVDKRNDKVFLNWKIPDKNMTVMIREIDSMPKLSLGDILSLNDIDSLGSPVNVISESSAQTNINLQGNIYYIPFSIRNETAVVGKIMKITTIKDVSNLFSNQNGQKIILTLTPPVGAVEFWISYRYDGFSASAEEKGNINKVISAEEYKRNRQIEINIDQTRKHYITVYTYNRKDHLFSTGIQTIENCGLENTIKYRVRYQKTFFMRKIEEIYVELESREKMFTLNNIVIVLKRGTVPLTKDDGNTIKNMKHVKFDEYKAKIKIPQKYHKENGYIKLFFNDAKDAKDVRLLPDKEEKLKLN